MQTPNQGARRNAVEEAFVVASQEIEIPPGDYEISNGLGWHPRNIALPENAWIHVVVSGGLTLDINPLALRFPGCADAPPECFPFAGITVGPEGGYGLAVKIAFQPGASAAGIPSGSTPGPVAQTYASPAASHRIEYLLRNGSAKNLWLMREESPNLICQNGSTCIPISDDPNLWERWVSAYSPRGYQTVTVTRVPKPVHVEGSKFYIRPDSSGKETLTFTAEVNSPFRLRGGRSHPDSVAISWYYVPYDTLAEPQPLVGYERYISECANQRTCAYSPWWSGRFVVKTYVEGQYVEDHSEIVWRKYPKLELSCTPATLTRGDHMSCAARANPSTPDFRVKRWHFSTISGFVSAQDTTGTNPWAGTMVVGGEISATARLDGRDLTANVPVTVTRRIWMPYTVEVDSVGQFGLIYPPRDEPHLASTSIANPRDYPLAGPIPFKRIFDGPNTGWWYLRHQMNPLIAAVQWNQAWSATDPWYLAQTGGPHPEGRWCDQADMPTVERLAREHEGLLQGPDNSHLSVFREYFASQIDPAATTPQSQMESVIRHDSTLVGITFEQVVYQEFDAAIRIPAIEDPRQRHYNSRTTDPGSQGAVPYFDPPCYLRYP